jgi:acetoin utilization deacetylase AcuC-like enzyme
VELSLEYQKPAIALVRPPGHHASVASAGGFCYFNNIAICASKFSKQYRVAIVDIDVHHGKGTAEIFYDKPLLYISTHHYGIYPGTGSLKEIGEKEGRGCTVNIPFFMGCGDASYSLACEKSLNTKY